MTTTADWISAVSAAVTALGVLAALAQLWMSRRLAELQFEDSLTREYRALIAGIPAVAFLGGHVDAADDEATFRTIVRYFDLTNEQIHLRQRRRISAKTWLQWRDGIRSNLRLPVMNEAWIKVYKDSDSFSELRRLVLEDFRRDPSTW